MSREAYNPCGTSPLPGSSGGRAPLPLRWGVPCCVRDSASLVVRCSCSICCFSEAMRCSCSACFARDEASCSAMSFVLRARLMELLELTVEDVDGSLAPVCAETPLIWLPISSCLVCLFPRCFMRLARISSLISRVLTFI